MQNVNENEMLQINKWIYSNMCLLWKYFWQSLAAEDGGSKQKV